nr:WD repeat-containing protein 34-like [Leptinotarsa decemlineata]
MFGTKHNECVGFESRWKVKKVISESSSQTTENEFSDKGTNTLIKTSMEVQTEEDDSTEVTSETDMQKLATWLSGVYPRVKKELDEANNSHAFRGYRLQGESNKADCKLLQIINVSGKTESGDKAMPKRVSTISWNQTGKTIAVACNFQHSTWCYHTGFVTLYTLTREEKIPDCPRKTLNTESCVMSLKFHPMHPAILAASTFSGGVVIWNVQNEDGEEIISVSNAHDEVITQLSWVNDVDFAKNLLIATSSTDGLLKLWNFNITSPNLLLKVRYRVKTPVLNSIHRKNESPENVSSKSLRGVTCFDFSKHVQDMFIVALEGGHIVQCSVLGTTELKGSTKEEPLLDPVFKYYLPHEGEVTSVSFSPNRSEMFMSCGTDAEIRVYLIGQEEPAQVIFLRHLMNDLTFIPHEEKLVAGCGMNSFFEIFHLQRGRPIENITSEKIKKTTSTSIAMNCRRNNIVAVGNINGELQLWNVPWRLFAIN